jgi:hypothetical protein
MTVRSTGDAQPRQPCRGPRVSHVHSMVGFLGLSTNRQENQATNPELSFQSFLDLRPSALLHLVSRSECLLPNRGSLISSRAFYRSRTMVPRARDLVRPWVQGPAGRRQGCLNARIVVASLFCFPSCCIHSHSTHTRVMPTQE